MKSFFTRMCQKIVISFDPSDYEKLIIITRKVKNVAQQKRGSHFSIDC